LEIVDENGGNGRFSMPTSTEGMMAAFCSSVETATMSRSIRTEKKKKKKK
jgi:ribose 5-phosphate isomerase RpiB